MACRHGREGYCYDDASGEEREAFDFLHGHSFGWALERGLTRADAELYAGLRAGELFRVPDEGWGRHTLEPYAELHARYPHVG